MKIIVMSKTSLDVTQYSDITNIAKTGTSIILTRTGGTLVTVDSTTHSVYIMES